LKHIDHPERSEDSLTQRGGTRATAVAPTRCFVLVPVVESVTPDSSDVSDRDAEGRLDEAIGLARAIDLEVVGQGTVRIQRPRPATLVGKGKVEEIAAIVVAEEIRLVVVDAPLSPAQQRNLERAWKAKVLDRTGLILEIFGARARTREGRLQVELAHLNWQKSRLVRSWTHLERQRGGFGFLGGPGETQIEADRRIIQERIVRIERELETVRRTRGLHRESRRRVPYPIIALAGYTNAGKSTLFNTLTRARVVAEDQLFATLDPTLRGLALPRGGTAILSDTVGFISDLPPHLVAAFRATLEEVVEADVILHVRDIAHPESAEQSADVTGILTSLGVDPGDHGKILEVWNKVDLLDADRREELSNRLARLSPDERPVLASAVTGEGLDELLSAVDVRLKADRSERTITIDPADGRSLNWIYERCDVIGRQDDSRSGRITLNVLVSQRRLSEFDERFPTLQD
jgi:GTPase